MNDGEELPDVLLHDRYLARLMGHSPASWRTHLRDDARRRIATHRDAALLEGAGHALVELGLLRDVLDRAIDPPAPERYVHRITLPAAALHVRSTERAVCDVHRALAHRSDRP